MKKIVIALLTIVGFASGVQAQDATLTVNNKSAETGDNAVNFSPRTFRADFKTLASVGLTGTGAYGTQITIAPWLDASGNKNHQLNFNDNGIFYRNATPIAETAWGPWRQFMVTNTAGNLDLNGRLIAGAGFSVDGQNILSGKYGNGTISNWGSLWSSSATYMGFAVKAHTGATAGAWVSSTPIAIAKSAITTDYAGFHVYATANNASVAEGTAVTLSENFTVRETGNVGVGTNNPVDKLTVQGGDASKIRIETASAPTTYFTTIESNYNAANTFNIRDGNILKFGSKEVGAGTNDTYMSGYYGLAFATQTVNVNPGNIRMYIKDNGNVGIGTIAPAYKLDVRGESYSQGHTIQSYSPELILKRNTDSGGYIQGIQTQLLDGTNNWFFGNYYADRWIVSKGDHQGSKFVVKDNGNVGIGVYDPQFKLDVSGKSSFSDNVKVNAKIEAKEIKVTTTPTADFVFEEDYNLPKLEEVEKHIKEKKHLPEIASAKEMEKEGVNVGEFQIKLLQKIEELTLYTIEQNKKIEAQNKQILEQNQRIEKLEKKIKS